VRGPALACVAADSVPMLDKPHLASTRPVAWLLGVASAVAKNALVLVPANLHLGILRGAQRAQLRGRIQMVPRGASPLGGGALQLLLVRRTRIVLALVAIQDRRARQTLLRPLLLLGISRAASARPAIGVIWHSFVPVANTSDAKLVLRGALSHPKSIFGMACRALL
jgi:hypothetical protein